VTFGTETLEPPVRRKRHPIRNTIIVLVIVAGLGISGYLVAESLARSFATQFVQTGVAQELDAPLDQVHVNLGKDSILLQVIQRSVKKMHVTIGSFTSGTLSGSAVFDARGVPLNTSDPVSTIDITVNVPGADLLGLVESASGQAQATVALQGNDIRISTTEKVLGRKVPVSVDFAVSSTGSDLVLTPANIVVNKKSYTPSALKKSRYGPLVSGLIVARKECLAAGLPKTMQVTSIVVKDAQLVVSAEGQNMSLGSLSDKGVCAAT
jgi:hypothetical protein